MIPKGEQHHTLVSLAGSMRRRGMDADEIEAALMVTNLKRLEDPAPAGDIRKDRAERREVPARPRPPTAPTAPAADPVAVAAMALGELLDLPTVGVKIRPPASSGRQQRRRRDRHVQRRDPDVRVVAGDDAPADVIAEVAACTGATPTLKQAQCAQAITLGQGSRRSSRSTARTTSRASGAATTSAIAETIDIDINDQAQRWRAFEMLAERRPVGQGCRRAPAAGLVLRHRDGSRFVRTLWFERYVKSRDASVSRTVIGPRMAKVGWERRGKHGDIKATARPFWVVPANWMPDEPPTE
jgi:hypothetical protein